MDRWIAATAAELMPEAAALRDAGHGRIVSYSKKVFIPLTRLCRDVCSYCTFAQAPRPGKAAYLSPDEVLAIARAGREAGCHEALFTLGDKPELRYRAAREELAARGYATTLEYLAAMCELVRRETELLPHANPGVMTRDGHRQPAPGERIAGHDAREHRGAALRPRRPALRLAGQATGRAARNAAAGGRACRAVHHRHPDRHRRDAARAHRGPDGHRARCTSATGTCRK